MKSIRRAYIEKRKKSQLNNTVNTNEDKNDNDNDNNFKNK